MTGPVWVTGIVSSLKEHGSIAPGHVCEVAVFDGHKVEINRTQHQRLVGDDTNYCFGLTSSSTGWGAVLGSGPMDN